MKAFVAVLLSIFVLGCGDSENPENVNLPLKPTPQTKAGELPENIRVRFDFLKGEVPEVVYEKVLRQVNATYQGHIRHLTFIHWIYNEARIPPHVFDKLEDDKQLHFYTLSKNDRLQVAAHIDYPEELPDVYIKTKGANKEAYVFYTFDSNYVLIGESRFGLHFSQTSFSQEFGIRHDIEEVLARIEDAISKRRNGRVVIPRALLDMGIHIIIIDIAGVPKEPKYRHWYVPLSKARRATPAEVEAHNNHNNRAGQYND